MTDTPRKRSKLSKYPVVAGTLATFMALFGFLTYQLRTGHDPALGGQSVAAAPLTKRVILKKIEDRIIVTRVLPAEDDGGGATVQLASVPAQTVQSSQPVVVQSAPAPAPAPAPLVTSASGVVR